MLKRFKGRGDDLTIGTMSALGVVTNQLIKWRVTSPAAPQRAVNAGRGYLEKEFDVRTLTTDRKSIEGCTKARPSKGYYPENRTILIPCKEYSYHGYYEYGNSCNHIYCLGIMGNMIPMAATDDTKGLFSYPQYYSHRR